MAQDDRGKNMGTEVIDLLSSRDMPVGRSTLQELEFHWRELKAAAPWLPRRADLDAGRIAAALPHAFILERVAPGVGRMRIAGQSLVGLLGGEARGLPLSVLFSGPSRAILQGWIEHCFEDPALVELPVAAPQGPLRATLGGRLILLPMLDAEGEATRALGGLMLNGALRRSPVRLEILDEPARCERLPKAGSFAYARHNSTATPALREAERPWLRLVVSNR